MVVTIVLKSQVNFGPISCVTGLAVMPLNYMKKVTDVWCVKKYCAALWKFCFLNVHVRYDFAGRGVDEGV